MPVLTGIRGSSKPDGRNASIRRGAAFPRWMSVVFGMLRRRTRGSAGASGLRGGVLTGNGRRCFLARGAMVPISSGRYLLASSRLFGFALPGSVLVALCEWLMPGKIGVSHEADGFVLISPIGARVSLFAQANGATWLERWSIGVLRRLRVNRA